MLVPEGNETVIGRHEEVVSGNVASGGEGWSVRRRIPGYIMPPLFLGVRDCAPCGESPPVVIEGRRMKA